MRGSSYYSSSTEDESYPSSESDASDSEFAPIRVRPAMFHEGRLIRFSASPSGFRNAVTRGHLVAFTASYRFAWVLLYLGAQDLCRLIFSARTVHRRLRRLLQLRA